MISVHYYILADRFRSHGNVSHHVQVALHPKIDHSKFRVFSGLGQQLGPISVFGAAGAIDGLANIFPKTISRLFSLASKPAPSQDDLEEARRLQWIVATAEEFIAENGIVGIRGAIHRVLGFGDVSGGRLPLKGVLADESYEKWSGILRQIKEEEDRL